jgi:RsiW-degrading membrane proteinase PrsW (M82 family)
VLFFVHWQWHRFDLSVDAVIKYFAYGFLLTTGITLFFETLISFVINVVFFIINIVSLISYLESSPISKPEDIYDLIASFAKTHQWIFILYFFANAFVVAALVEETTKYFAFWSMEHPDFSEISSPPDRRAILRRNRESYGAAITVAMVAAATGFACCEDLGYIFSPSSTVQDGE